MTQELKIIGEGGRIKGAAENFTDFPTDPIECFKYIQEQRKRPDFKYVKSYFPLSNGEIKQHIARLGLFRSSFKTDQGMPGNFSVFYIDPKIKEVREIEFIGEEGLAFPENRHFQDGLVKQVQQEFLEFNLKETSDLIEGLGRSESLKGRQPFFFVRAAIPRDKPTIGVGEVDKVEKATSDVVEIAVEKARHRAHVLGQSFQDDSLIYVQPDAYITRDEKVFIETVHAPDVGMFFGGLGNISSSKMLPKAKETMKTIGQEFLKNLLEKLESLNTIYVVSRDEVVIGGTDILEHGDIKVITDFLKENGKNVEVVAISQIYNLFSSDDQAGIILMNIDYNNLESKKTLLSTRSKYPRLRFFPDPFLQEELRLATGLKSLKIELKFKKIFLDLLKGSPDLQKPIGISEKYKRIKELLQKQGIETDIIRIRFGSETIIVPIYASQALTLAANRIAKFEDENGNIDISIDAIPLNEDNALISDTSGGKRMQVFRFGATTK